MKKRTSQDHLTADRAGTPSERRSPDEVEGHLRAGGAAEPTRPDEAVARMRRGDEDDAPDVEGHAFRWGSPPEGRRDVER
jgi:hypothetical protein